MPVLKIISYLAGYVTIFAWGDSLEKFVNLAASRGIYLWDIQREGPNEISAKMRVSGIKPLRHIARRTRCRFSIDDRRGLPFILLRMKRRKTFVAGIILFVVSLYLMSSFIWDIDVTGNHVIKSSEIYRAAAEAGLARGSLKWAINTTEVEEKILKELPVAAWVGVYIKGTRATIEIAEKKVPEKIKSGPSNIVAKKAGLVKEILVLSGNPVVKEGDTVLPGRVLISGEVMPAEPPAALPGQPGPENNEEEAAQEQQPTYVRAKGIVRARVWYEGYGEAQIVDKGQKPSGRSLSRFCIKINDKEIILTGPEEIPFKDFESEVAVKKLPAWRNITVPVELRREKYNELISYQRNREPAEAKKLAVEKALKEVKEKLPRGVTVLNKRVEEVDAGRPENLVRVKVVIETLEDIGVEKPFAP